MMKDEEQKNFFEFIASNKAEGEFASKLQQYVSEAKQKFENRRQFMEFERELTYKYDEGLEKGLVQGLAQGARQTAIKNAITIVKKYNAKPEVVAADVGAPLDEVLAALNSGK